MYGAGRYLYTGFMCHQSIEKMLKAYYIFLKDEAQPQTHNLNALAKQTALYDKLTDAFKQTLIKLDPLYIKARYEDYKNVIADLLTNEYCGELLAETEVLGEWIKSLMKT
jgi:HEPN domain-containing protein